MRNEWSTYLLYSYLILLFLFLNLTIRVWRVMSAYVSFTCGRTHSVVDPLQNRPADFRRVLWLPGIVKSTWCNTFKKRPVPLHFISPQKIATEAHETVSSYYRQPWLQIPLEFTDCKQAKRSFSFIKRTNWVCLCIWTQQVKVSQPRRKLNNKRFVTTGRYLGTNRSVIMVITPRKKDGQNM